MKGEAYVWVLTDEPEEVLTPGRRLTPVDGEGHAVGLPIVIERSRTYHRQCLLKFQGIDDRTELKTWGQMLLGVPADQLAPPAEGEIYAHEVPGIQVMVGDEVIGTAVGLVDGAGGELLAVEVRGREVLVPFRKPIVKSVDRAARRIELDPPPGLLDL